MTGIIRGIPISDFLQDLRAILKHSDLSIEKNFKKLQSLKS